MTNEYYAVNGLDYLTRIGSFRFPGCTTVGNGTVSGTVTAGGGPVATATVSLGSRTTTTDIAGRYSFTIPAGTYPSLSASARGFDPGSVADVTVPDGARPARLHTHRRATKVFTDNTQNDFEAGTSTGCDLTSDPGSVQLADAPFVDQSSGTLGTSAVGITTTTFGGQTFTPDTTGRLTKVDVNLFCSGCTGTTPDLTLSIRATNGGLPTGADLASATITGFNLGAAADHTATFASPITLTAGTQYAFVVRPTANPPSGTYALTRSGTSTASSGRVLRRDAGRRFDQRDRLVDPADRRGEHRHRVQHLARYGARVVGHVRVFGEGREPGTRERRAMDNALLRGDDARRHRRQVPGRGEQVDSARSRSSVRMARPTRSSRRTAPT